MQSYIFLTSFGYVTGGGGGRGRESQGGGEGRAWRGRWRKRRVRVGVLGIGLGGVEDVEVDEVELHQAYGRRLVGG